MPTETVYADLVLAVAALIAGVLYLRARRRHGKRKKSGPPVRPATPTPQAAAGRGPIVGSPGSGRSGGASGPDLGLAGTRAIIFGAASTTLVGCAQARRPTAGRGAVMGQ